MMVSLGVAVYPMIHFVNGNINSKVCFMFHGIIATKAGG